MSIAVDLARLCLTTAVWEFGRFSARQFKLTFNRRLRQAQGCLTYEKSGYVDGLICEP
jgi:hypothetical protein